MLSYVFKQKYQRCSYAQYFGDEEDNVEGGYSCSSKDGDENNN